MHLLVGGIALPDDNLGDGHRHYYVKVGANWQQVTVGAVDHTHNCSQSPTGNPIPDWFLLFWSGTNADASAINASLDNFPIVEAPVDSEGAIGDLESIQWDAAELSAWQNRMLNILGVQLPDEVDRGSRLVKLFLGALLSRQSGDERGYRFT